MSRTIAVQTEINVHQAIKAIIAFARGSFGNNDGWLTENEAIDLVAAAEMIQQNLTRAKQVKLVCDICGEPVEINGRQYVHSDREGWQKHLGPFRDRHFSKVNGKEQA